MSTNTHTHTPDWRQQHWTMSLQGTKNIQKTKKLIEMPGNRKLRWQCQTNAEQRQVIQAMLHQHVVGGDLDDSVHEACVHVDDKDANERHLLPRVLEYQVRIVRLTAKAVWSHHHRQVAGVHLSNSRVLSRGKHLQTAAVRCFHRAFYFIFVKTITIKCTTGCSISTRLN